jgi:hypothetical protein
MHLLIAPCLTPQSVDLYYGILQGWLVMAFVWAERMARAGCGGQIHKAGGADAAILALVFGLLGSLIQNMFTFACAHRVARTTEAGQAGDAGGFDPAILAILFHNGMLDCFPISSQTSEAIFT